MNVELAAVDLGKAVSGTPQQIRNGETKRMKRNIGCIVAPLLLAISLSAPLPAQEKPDMEPEAMAALNNMGTYLRTLKDFQVKAEITEEDVLDDGEKVQFGTTTNILAHLPDKLRVDVDGEQKSRLFLYDGKSFTFFARREAFYATVHAPDTIGKLIDVVNEKYELEIPLLDLFLWGGPRASTNEITAADDYGPGVVDGVTCEHYLYRQPGLDWQVWIQLGDHPLPRKMVLTTLTDEARPEHTSVLTWNLAPSYSPDAFVFDPPPDTHKIVFAGEKDAAESK